MRKILKKRLWVVTLLLITALVATYVLKEQVIIRHANTRTYLSALEASKHSDQETNQQIKQETNQDTKQETKHTPSHIMGDDLTPKEKTTSEKIEDYMAQMTIEEKIGQLFIIAIRKDQAGAPIKEVNEAVKALLKNYPVGGIILFKENIDTPKQVQQLIKELQANAQIPLFIGVDEEGGSVSRVGSNAKINEVPFKTAFSMGEKGDLQLVYNEALRMGNLLKHLGFNMDFAPVADIYNEPQNTVIGKRSFGKTAETVTPMVIQFSKGLRESGILPVIKHFPGHGNTLEDSHEGLAYLDKTISELESQELVPFKKALQAGGEALMRGHLVAKGIDDDAPASLSRFWGKYLLEQYNCNEVLLMTDAMDMGAISSHYEVEEATKLCIAAENDICLMPADIERAYKALLESYEEGNLTEERINRSVRKILSKKVALNALVLE